jgi:hypothetical protein
MTSQSVSHNSVQGIAWQAIADFVSVLSTTRGHTDLMILVRIKIVFYDSMEFTSF